MTCHTKQHRTLPLHSRQETRDAYGLPSVDDYDGQGKSQQQETDDSMAALVIACILATLIGGLLVAMIDLGPVVVSWMGR